MAEIVTGVAAVTVPVAMRKVAVDSPAGIFTVLPLGKVAAGLLLASVMTAPPAGAGPPSEIVPVTVVAPPTTKSASVVSCASSGG